MHPASTIFFFGQAKKSGSIVGPDSDFTDIVAMDLGEPILTPSATAIARAHFRCFALISGAGDGFA